MNKRLFEADIAPLVFDNGMNVMLVKVVFKALVELALVVVEDDEVCVVLALKLVPLAAVVLVRLLVVDKVALVGSLTVAFVSVNCVVYRECHTQFCWYWY